jgi:hypothetical protein
VNKLRHNFFLFICIIYLLSNHNTLILVVLFSVRGGRGSESGLLLNSLTLSSALVLCIHAPVLGALRESLSFKQETWYEAIIFSIFSSSEILHDLRTLLSFHSSLRVHELNSAIPMTVICVLLFGVEF